MKQRSGVEGEARAHHATLLATAAWLCHPVGRLCPPAAVFSLFAHFLILFHSFLQHLLGWIYYLQKQIKQVKILNKTSKILKIRLLYELKSGERGM